MYFWIDIINMVSKNNTLVKIVGFLNSLLIFYALKMDENYLKGINNIVWWLRIYVFFLLRKSKSFICNKYVNILRSLLCSITKLCPTLCKPLDCSMSNLLCPSSLGVCSNSCPLSRWCYLIISASLFAESLLKD